MINWALRAPAVFIYLLMYRKQRKYNVYTDNVKCDECTAGQKENYTCTRWLQRLNILCE